MKLSAKFARQENEEARRARVARRRISSDRIEAIRRMLGVVETAPAPRAPRAGEPRSRGLSCPDCERTFALPMHLGRHRKAAHERPDAA
jgi:hypothetical protein